jgi:23S rRNA pseudouridine2605 synthase
MIERRDSRRIGLARALSKLGYCSRSKASELIRLGRVTLNGSVRRNPEAPVVLGRDRIEVDQRPVESESKIYLMYNKPRGLVTTASDEKGRETVYSALQDDFPWVAPVGRLDKASEGLLLLTNDSEWAARVTAPETHLDKTYHVQIRGRADELLAWRLMAGCRLDQNELLQAKRASILRTGDRNTWMEVVLDQGKNRQIRRMMRYLGFEVLRLVRTAIGPLPLADLAKATVRHLTVAEKRALDIAMDRAIDRAKDGR